MNGDETAAKDRVLMGPMQAQRWQERRHTFRRPDEQIRTSEYEVAVLDESTAKAFVLQHHYSASYPAARFRHGLYRHGSLVGVAVFSQPAANAVLTNVFEASDIEPYAELGRFVLLDEVAAGLQLAALSDAPGLLRLLLHRVRPEALVNLRVARERIVTFDYTVRVDGAVVEHAPPDTPVTYMHGAGTLLDGLERALTGMQEDDRREFVLLPGDAYGIWDPDRVDWLPREAFPADVAVGLQLGAHLSDGTVLPLKVLSLSATHVEVDMNHPHAGRKLAVEVHIQSVRLPGVDERFLGRPKNVEVV